MNGRWHYIDQITCGPSEPQMVKWSAISDPTSWNRPKPSGRIKFSQGHRRGLRKVAITIAGSDAYGKPVSEPVAVFIHWRKHKRMMRKMGR